MRSDPAATLLVVPCCNERGRLRPGEYLDFLSGHAWLHLFMVDDGSDDGTWTVLESMRAQALERITTLRLGKNRGKAEAVRQGMLRVLEGLPSPGKEFSLAGYWDADLSTPLEALPLFLDAFVERLECRLVVGSRVRLLGRRNYLGRVFSTFASLSLDLPIYDTQCGAKLFRADEELRSLFSRPFSSSCLFDVEILLRLRTLWGVDTPSRIVETAPPGVGGCRRLQGTALGRRQGGDDLDPRLGSAGPVWLMTSPKPIQYRPEYPNVGRQPCLRSPGYEPQIYVARPRAGRGSTNSRADFVSRAPLAIRIILRCSL